MRKPVVKKLGDGFGDYVLTIACRPCGHTRATEPAALAKIVGWDVPLEALARRLRCSRCGAKDCKLEALPKPRPRGRDWR